jgi:HK97 family phage major capsid protein
MKLSRFSLPTLGIAVALVAVMLLCAIPEASPLHHLLPTTAVGYGVLLAGAPIAPFALLERKDDNGGDGDPGVKKVKELIEQQGQAWADYRKTNDERLKELETKGQASAEYGVKLGKIEADLNKASAELAEVLKKMQRPSFGAGGEGKLTPEQLEHKKALGVYLRKGDDDGLGELERKAMNMGSDPDGGFFIGSEMDGEIDRVAAVEMSFADQATTRSIGKTTYKKMVKTRGVSGGWIGEQEDSAEGTGPQFVEIEIPAHRIYAEPWVTNDMLEDAEYDLEGDLVDETGITFGEIEGNAFINGDGVKKPRGLLAYPTVANANYAWGKVGFIKTGANGAFAAAAGDNLISLQHSLKQRYRSGAGFLMADSTLSTVRQVKDGSGAYYLWQPDPTGSFGGRLLGSPVTIDDYMPAVAASAFGIAYGNFKRAYTIVRRRGIVVIRDNVTKKGVTKFHLSRRTGGGVTNFEAFKLLKFEA